MTDSSDTIHRTAICVWCGGSLAETRFVRAGRSPLELDLDLYCSEACLEAAGDEEDLRRRGARRREVKWLALGFSLFGACLTPHEGPLRAPRLARSAPRPTAGASGPSRLPPGWFGPEWPPTETSLLAALGRDAWVHPLAGPFRRMPRSDSRVFGAGRPGDRAIECRNGHCGVDLGGEIWGEHVHAAHDGVVDWVQRGPNPQRGGEFVRLSHHDGTVFTQYFHLAAIPRGLERGTPVKAGDVIGLLGDTGVKESEPHLHFAISIRTSTQRPEKYIDPEPLIALWPLRVPIDGGEAGLVTTVAQPGVPLGSAPLLPGHRKKLGKQRRAPDDAAPRDGDTPGESRESPPADEPAPGAETPESSTGD